MEKLIKELQESNQSEREISEAIKEKIQEQGYIKVEANTFNEASIWIAGTILDVKPLSNNFPICIAEKGNFKKTFFYTVDYEDYEFEFEGRTIWKLYDVMNCEGYFSSKEKGFVFDQMVGEEYILSGTSYQQFDKVEVTADEYLKSLKALELRGFVTSVKVEHGKYANTLCFETKDFLFALVEKCIEVRDHETDKIWFIPNPFRIL